jgi:hypothetical protein
MSDARENAVKRVMYMLACEAVARPNLVTSLVSANTSGLRTAADSLLRELALVAIDPALVDEVRWCEEHAPLDQAGAVRDAKLALADAVLAQMRDPR